MKKYKVIKRPTPINDTIKNKKTENCSRSHKKLEHIEKQSEESYANAEISGCIDSDMQYIREIFKNCSDLIIRRMELGEYKTPCFAAYLGTLIKREFVNENFLKPLMTEIRLTGVSGHSDKGINASDINASSLYSFQVNEFHLFKDVIGKLLVGYCILFIDGSKTALAADTKGETGRKVSEPRIEMGVRGPQEAFVEDLGTNVSLLRQRIKTPDLKLEMFEPGRLSSTQAAISYVSGLADDKTVNEVKTRINRIDIDIILDSSYIEKFIRDSAYSPFPQMVTTERPDKCAAALAEGRIVVLIEGSPNALVIPVTFSDFLVAAEDYYHHFYFSTLIRILRYLAFIIALLGPAFYLAITTFHQEMIPLPLLITITRSRADIPFPAIVEALMMEFTFELLREAGIRLPQPVGPAVSIVGGLVIGQGVVQAGIVSQTMVIVVALTGIASFAMPTFNLAVKIRFLRFPFMLLASTLGMYGIIMGILVMLIHMAGLRSFGVPYLSPFAPGSLKDLKDSIAIAPLWTMSKRPSFIQKNNPSRMKKNIRQEPESNDGG
ncbi:MAG: spore germination protein [Ruminiclostridium sp.]|nr:spore germination protein [Ruminiclostridium sp.]